VAHRPTSFLDKPPLLPVLRTARTAHGPVVHRTTCSVLYCAAWSSTYVHVRACTHVRAGMPDGCCVGRADRQAGAS